MATISWIATATSSTAKRSDIARSGTLCWRLAPTITPPIAGIPISIPLR